jgi:hypothetical protein
MDEAEKLLSCKVKSKFENILGDILFGGMIIGAIAISWLGVYVATVMNLAPRSEFALLLVVTFLIDAIILFAGFSVCSGLCDMKDIVLGCGLVFASGISVSLKVALICYRYAPMWVSVIMAVAGIIAIAYVSIWLWCEVDKYLARVKNEEKAMAGMRKRAEEEAKKDVKA